MSSPYPTIKEIITFVIIFAVIVWVCSWIGGREGGYNYAPPDSSWESAGF